MAIIGIDVSKAKLDCLWLRDPVSLKIKSKVFPNTPAGHQALLAWLEKQTGAAATELHCVMEATGIYHEGLAYALHGAGARVSVVNPAQLREYAKSLGTRTKTDKKDALVIARFGATQPLREWQPEPAEVRQLKALLARYEAVKQDIQRELNRLEKAQITQTSAAVLTSIETVHQQLEAERTRLEALINEHIDQNPGLKQDRDLLESIPGVGPVIAQQMVALLRSLLRAYTQQHYYLTAQYGRLAVGGEKEPGPLTPTDSTVLLDTVRLINDFISSNIIKADNLILLGLA